MPEDHPRYAVYWVPSASDPLAEFGCRWTGWCPETGEKHARLASPAEGLDLETITRETSRHGLHAVLMPPLRLLRRREIWALQSELSRLADELTEVPVPALGVAVVAGRVALVPKKASPRLDHMVRRVREATARFLHAGDEPAPEPGAAGVAGDATGPAEGFHLPLTDRLSPDIAALLVGRIRPLLAGALAAEQSIGDFALVSDPGEGRRATVVEHYFLSDRSGPASDHAFACRGPRVYAPLSPADQVPEPIA